MAALTTTKRPAARRDEAAQRASTLRASSIVVGTVRHRRYRPHVNAFRYRTFHLLLDLDELDALERSVAGFGHRRRRPVRFADRDHFGRDDLPVRDKLARVLADHGTRLPDGPVQVLAYPRLFGHVFNPVSWWFCHDAHGRLAVVVAEVANTFGDTHNYVLDDLDPVAAGVWRARTDKVFHVSPFLPIEGLAYDFVFALRDDAVLVDMKVRDEQGTILDATQAGRRSTLGTRSLWRTLATNPLMSLSTLAFIHWQALRLLRRRVRFHRRPPGGLLVRSGARASDEVTT